METSTANATNVLTKILVAIAIIGAINWGLIGFFNFNLVDAIFGGGRVEETSSISRVIYGIVGICGLVAAFLLPTLRRPHGDDRRLVRGAV